MGPRADPSNSRQGMDLVLATRLVPEMATVSSHVDLRDIQKKVAYQQQGTALATRATSSSTLVAST